MITAHEREREREGVGWENSTRVEGDLVMRYIRIDEGLM